MRTGQLGLLAALLIACVVGLAVPAQGAPSLELREKLKKADQTFLKANVAFRAKKYQESGDLLKEVQKALAELASEKEIAPAVKASAAKAKSLRTELELQGISVPEITGPADSMTATSTPKPGAPAPKPGAPAAGAPVVPGGPVSFTKQVAPLLVAKCGRCHVTDAKGGVNMNTFANLMKGPNEGAIVLPGKGTGSRLIEVIESGDMPRGGNKVTKDEMAMLVKWIDEGAKFDGTDMALSLTRIVPTTGQPMPALPRLEVALATGKESISFARDIAPVLAANCINCHGDQQPRARLNLNHYTTLLRGSENDLIVKPGSAAESLVIKKIRGLAGARMPLNKPALSAETIAKFEKWVAEGAKFDGYEPAQTVALVADTYKAEHSTHDELSTWRSSLADKTWRLGVPDDKPIKKQTTNFLIVGNLTPEQMDEVGVLAEAQAAKISAMLKAPADAPLVRGRITLFVFRNKIDYSEFGKMVEDNRVPREWRGHWKYNVIDAYGAVLDSAGESPMNGIISQQIAAAYVASLGRVPAWFAEGMGREIASRLDRKDVRTKAWDERVPEVLGSLGKPDSFMARDAYDEGDAIAAYSFVKMLWGAQPAKFGAFLTSLRSGEKFDASFAKTFGMTTQQAATAWGGAAARAKPTTGRRTSTPQPPRKK